MRPAGAAMILMVALGPAGCGLIHSGPEPAPYTPPVTTTTAAAAVIPEELTTAVWTRATETMEVDLKILPDGRYRSVEIYSPAESGGIYQLQRVEDGVAQVSGNRLRLAGSTAKVTRTAEDDAGGNYERTTATRTGTYSWQVSGDRLHLTDADGKDAVFTRTAK
jgi:hypothetical protein